MKKNLIALSFFVLASVTFFFFQNLSVPTGLVPDHRVGSNGISSGIDGRCNGTTFTSPTGAFTASDVGKVFIVTGDTNGKLGAGPGTFNKAPLITTVAAVKNLTTITLTDPCSSKFSDLNLNSAQWDIGTDNSLYLQSCINSDSCTIPAGNYLFNQYVRIPSNRILTCQAGAILFFGRHDDYNTYNLVKSRGDQFYSGNMMFLDMYNTQNSVVRNCTIVGSNLNQVFTVGIEANFGIVMYGNAFGNTIMNNTFKNLWSNGDVSINGRDANIPRGNTVYGNTFKNCGFNGMSIVTGRANTIQNNHFYDCNFDIEPNNSINGPVHNNLIQKNDFHQVNRPGRELYDQGKHTITTKWGDQWAVSFVPCAPSNASGACDSTGGDTISVYDNSFYGEVLIAPYHVDGKLSQNWSNNKLLTSNGATCKAGAADCGYFYGATPTSSSNIDITSVQIINDLLLGIDK